jgi:hypothetical protein
MLSETVRVNLNRGSDRRFPPPLQAASPRLEAATPGLCGLPVELILRVPRVTVKRA